MANAALKDQPQAGSAFKITIDRSKLLKSLSHVQSVVERRGTIPILSNVKLEANGEQLTLTTTDMDIAVEDRVGATVQTAGGVTVPANTFYEIVRKLPDGSQVELKKEASENKLTLRCGSSRFSLSTLPTDDFPTMAEGDLAHSFTMRANECLSLIEKTRFAVSTEETRYYLNGVYLHATEKDGASVMRAVATDGHRLARIEVAMPEGAKGHARRDHPAQNHRRIAQTYRTGGRGSAGFLVRHQDPLSLRGCYAGFQIDRRYIPRLRAGDSQW